MALVTVRLPSWLFDSSILHDSSYDMWISWTSMLHYINLHSMAHNSDVSDMTHDTTRHESASMFMMVVGSMWSCSVVEWWMCSWCITSSPPHGKVCRVFDGLGVLLMLYVHVSRLLVLWHASHVRLFVKKSPHMHRLFAKNSPRMHRLFEKNSPCMHRLFICSGTHLLACALLVHRVHRRIMSYPCICIYNHSWWDEIESINLLVYHDALWFAFRRRWPGERTRLWNCTRKVSSWGSIPYNSSCKDDNDGSHSAYLNQK